ncbi:glycosyltransferase family 4 protein [Wenyingzhuangia marina]|uniref:Glycosyltransferase involved in cell wall bisynthesis n=1 Tax=Wenyingzhuangia marina TaxID=1195760 RepID=A0A1M5W213_9FLAO|nr:glycosyltransferase family 4 protein [Wenyingzhuangia marina]GGF76580.1 glycosyl transferase family 1 [Wenyingzhuangia marina]SHH81264.1 Glycosyltransferase involved in cell wall bisynthesis [Wenyingzhuangia marina]
MRVLVITYYWPPAGGSGVQRWLKFVKYLQDFDITPVVYTVENPDYPIVDATLCNDIPKGIEVIKQPIWEPNQIMNVFANKKKVKTSAGFLGTKRSLSSKIATYIRANYFIPDARMFWIKPSITYLEKYLSENKIDVIISTGPPHTTHMIGLGLKKKLNIRWIADFRDPWTEIDYFHQLPLTQKSIKKHEYLEQEVLKHADEVLVVGNQMKKSYDVFSKNVHVITNGFDGEVSTEKNLDEAFTITHIGMLNADRNPMVLWKALSLLKNKIDFKVQLIGKVAQEVKESIERYQLSGKITFIDYLPHEEVKSYQQKSQVLLLAVNNVPSAKGIVTGKIFEYLQAQRPIVAIAPTDGDLAVILEKSKAGFVVDFKDVKKLTEILVDLHTQFKLGALTVNSVGVEQYHRKSLTGQLANIIKK